MIKNALNGAWLESYILQTINHQADKDLARKCLRFSVEIRDIHKIEKKNSIVMSIFRYEHKERYKIYVSKKCCKKLFLH